VTEETTAVDGGEEAVDLSIKPDEIDWRVGSTYDGRDGKMGMLLGYINARLCMEKLDLLDPKWSSHIEPIELRGEAGVRCTLTVGGVSREDVGTVSDIESLKGAFSDALKRTAVHFGIGRELYDLPSIGVQCEVKSNGKVGKPKALPVWKNNRWTIDPALGWVKYDHDPPIEKPRPVKVNVTRDAPVALHPSHEAQATMDAVLGVTGGEEVDGLPPIPADAQGQGTSWIEQEIGQEQPDVVEITPSTVGKVERGGVTDRANESQIRQVKIFSKSLKLGPHGVIDEYNSLFAANLTLPEDKRAASDALLVLLDAMSNAQISKLIQRFSEMESA
jgi:hypothetical protein